MKLYQKIIGIATAVVVIGLTVGCKRNTTLEGTVKEEFGTAQRIVDSSGAIFGNESVKFGDPTYGLVLETDKGEYVIIVNNYHTKPITALAKAIEPGDIVRIRYDQSTKIGNDGIGKTDSDTIELLGKGHK